MSLPDLEAMVPGLRECRDAEHFARALAFAGVTRTLCGSEAVHLTPRHRLEFQLAQNAFAVQARPLAGDVFQFLWRLHPQFRRTRWTPRAWLAHRRVTRVVRAMPVGIAAHEIKTYLKAMLQDMPESRVGTEQTPVANTARYVHWVATESAFFMTRFNGFTLNSYLDTPYLVLQQLMRAWREKHEEDATFINESDRIVNRWQRHQREQMLKREGN